MTASDLTLNIALNMGRLSRFALDGRERRVKQFIEDSEQYIRELENSEINEKFKPTLERFKKDWILLKKSPVNYDWAEKALTWANILQHRAKLA